MPGVERVLKNSAMKVLDNGYAVFPGVEIGGGKKIASFYKTESNGRKGVTVIFADGNVYAFDYAKNGSIPSDVKQYWNGNEIYGEDE